MIINTVPSLSKDDFVLACNKFSFGWFSSKLHRPNRRILHCRIASSDDLDALIAKLTLDGAVLLVRSVNTDSLRLVRQAYRSVFETTEEEDQTLVQSGHTSVSILSDVLLLPDCRGLCYQPISSEPFMSVALNTLMSKTIRIFMATNIFLREVFISL